MTRGRRIVVARLLRTLATIEHLSFVGNESEVRRLLAGIDPIECRELAAELDEEIEQYVPTARGLRVVAEIIPESLRA